jgi:hypothetical protein
VKITSRFAMKFYFWAYSSKADLENAKGNYVDKHET